MIEVLEFIFSDFIHFLGCFMLCSLACIAISNARLFSITIVKNGGNDKGDDEAIS